MNINPARSFFWVMLETGGLSVLSLIVLFAIARILGPADLGTAVLALGIIQLIAIVPETLMLDAIVQRREITDNHLDTAFLTCLSIGLICTGSLILAAPILGKAFGSAALAPLLSVAALSLSISGVGCVPMAVLRRNFSFKAIALRSIYGRLAGAVVAIVLAASGFGVWSLIAQYCIQTAVNVLCVWFSCPWRPRLRFELVCLRELLSFGIVSMGTRIVWISSTKLFTVLVGYFLGVTAVGYLNVAQRVVDTLHDMLAGVAYNLAFPIFSRQQDDPILLARTYHAGTELVGLLIVPIFIGIAVCADPIIALFVGPGWSVSVRIAQVLAVAALLEFPFLFAEAAITAVGRPGYLLCVSLLALAFFLGAFFIAPPRNVLIAAVMWGGKIFVTAPVVYIMLRQIINRSLSDLVEESWPPLVGAGIMTAILILFQSSYSGQWSPFAALFVEIPLGAAVYVLTIGFIQRESLLRLLTFVLSGIRGDIAAAKKA